MDAPNRDDGARLELDDGKSMREVYDTGSGFYDSLVKAASCSYIRPDDDSWLSKLRFLTPIDQTTCSAILSGQYKWSGERAACCCKLKGYQAFNGSETKKLRLTSFNEIPTCAHYVAVSYCWNSWSAESSSSSDEAYEIVSSEGRRRNRAPYKLIKCVVDYAAYRGFPFIWIDQECIDQDNEEEKQSIIDEMDRVFRRARRVVALLTTMIGDVDYLKVADALMERESIVGLHNNDSPRRFAEHLSI